MLFAQILAATAAELDMLTSPRAMRPLGIEGFRRRGFKASTFKLVVF
jgi:hypothetical protein